MKALVFPMTTQFASTVSQETYTCFLFHDKIYQDVFLLTNASSLVSLDLGTLRLAHGRKGNPQQSRGLHAPVATTAKRIRLLPRVALLCFSAATFA